MKQRLLLLLPLLLLIVIAAFAAPLTRAGIERQVQKLEAHLLGNIHSGASSWTAEDVEWMWGAAKETLPAAWQDDGWILYAQGECLGRIQGAEEWTREDAAAAWRAAKQATADEAERRGSE